MPKRNWTPTASFVFILLTLIGCTTDRAAETPSDVDTKFDAPLRQALRGAPDTTLQVFIELNDDLSDDERAALTDAELVNISGSAQIVTATGTPAAIRRAAALPFVLSLSLSQHRPPLN